MKRHIPIFALLCLLALQAIAADKPNFVFINIDDMGYADIEPFGSKLNRTPNLTRMAAEGRKLTSFYAAPVCSPSRAALMTGCYPKRALPIPHVLFPANAEGLHPDEVTVAELLKEQGYSTAILGKWHLGDQPEFLPTRQGFDYWYGLPYSNDMGPAADGIKSDLGKPLPKTKPNQKGQPPLPLMRNDTVLQRVLPDDQQALVERYTDEAVRFLRQNREKPFFLYLPHSAVHFPIYPGKRFAGQSPHGIYSDWVEEVDWSVGRVLDTLRELKLESRTLVIFTSDNGGTRRASNHPLRGYKGSTWEGGMRVPTIAWWPGRIPGGTATDAITGMFDILPTFVKLAGGQLPADRKLDGVDIWPVLAGDPGAKPPREVFHFFRGLNLEAIREGDWKLRLGDNTLFNLRADLGEATDVAAAHPETVARLQALANRMQDDLGLKGRGPGVRALGKAANPKPILDYEGHPRPDLRSPEKKHAAAPPKPNVVFILADDLGYADCGFNGGKEIKTPHLDTLARAGTVLESFYVQPVCSPTRAALMTGRYPMRHGLQVGVITPGAPFGLPLEERTLPSALREAGYTTAICGKWHLGEFEKAYWPNARGFDHAYGHLFGALDYFTRMRNGQLDWYRNGERLSEEGYNTHLIAAEAVRFIKTQSAAKPFLLYVPFNAVHTPLQVPEEYMAPYNNLPEPRRKLAGMLAAMDEAVGQIVAAIEEKGLRQRTLFIFSSDNGGPRPGKVTDNSPLRGGKGGLYEGGVRVCAFVTWDGHVPVGKRLKEPLHIVDWFPTLLNLAGASLGSENQELPLDGLDLWPTLTAGRPSPHDEILLNSAPRSGAIRVGDWKLKLQSGPRRSAEQVELFNLASDIGETNNLAEANPRKVKDLRARYDRWAAQAVPPKNKQ